MNKIIRLILLVFMLLCISCLYIPLSEHGHNSSIGGFISEDTMKLFIPGKTTRADILLRSGVPAQRVEEDRYFIYYWEAIEGHFMAGCGGKDVITRHYLCFEFAPDNILKRYKHFEQERFGELIGRHPEKQILDWMKEDSKHNIDG